MEHRPSMTALFRNGAANGLQNLKHKRLFESLQWRQAYLNSEYYEYSLEPSTQLCLPGKEGISVPPIRVKQILNGEMKGLGTGTFVWPAAHVLAKYLEKRYHATGLHGKRVCDIGCGTGLVGFLASLLGGTVVLTDLELLLPLIEENMQLVRSDHQNIQITSKIYNWEDREQLNENSFDLLLISDCILPKLYPISLLVDAVDHLLTNQTIALFSYEHRPFPQYDPRQEFQRLCSLKGLDVHIIPMTEHHSTYCAEDIELWEVVRNDSLVSSSIQSRKEALEFELKDWGEEKTEIRFALNGREYSVKQLGSAGVGGAIWPSSVICSRKIMQKDFRKTLAEKVYSSIANRQSLSYHVPPRLSRDELEEKKKNLDFRGVTVLDLGAGCGLTSIVFHHLGFNVVATDKLSIMNILEENLHHYLSQIDTSSTTQPKDIPSTEVTSSAIIKSSNTTENDERATFASESPQSFLKIVPFDWELEHDSFKISENNIDLILCSDCLYNSIVVEPLIRVIQMNVKKELLVLLVNELRTSLEEFLYLIRHYDAHYEVTVEEVLITEPELELIRSNDVMKFSPPIRMCFIKFVKITHSNSFDDISQDGSQDHRDSFHRQSSDSLDNDQKFLLEADEEAEQEEIEVNIEI